MKIEDPRQTGLGPRFDFVVSGEDCTAYKPDPEIYQRTLDGLGLKPEDVIAVEDSPAGIASAKRAGIKVFALYSRGQDQSGADRVIETLGELLTWI